MDQTDVAVPSSALLSSGGPTGDAEKKKTGSVPKKRRQTHPRQTSWDRQKRMTVEELSRIEDGSIPIDWDSHSQPLCRWTPEGQRSAPSCFRVARHKENSDYCSQHCPEYLRAQQDKIVKLLKSTLSTAVKKLEADEADGADDSQLRPTSLVTFVCGAHIFL